MRSAARSGEPGGAGRRWRAGLLRLSLSVGLGAGLAQPAGAEEIRIGGSAALSGPAATLGQRYHAGARALFEQVNQRQAGIGGARIVMDLRDDGYEPERAEANTRELIEDPAVLALFGFVGTPTSRVALPYVRRTGMAFVGAFTGAGLLREPQHSSVFNVRASYREEARALAQAMKAAGVRRYQVVYQADLFGREGLEAMRAATAPLGLELVGSAMVKRNSVEVGAGVTALLTQQSGAEAIFLVSTYETCAAFVKQARERGYRGRFYALSFTGLEPLRAALGRAPNELTMSQVVPDPEDAGVPVVAAYQKAMREAGDRHFDAISLEGYIAARVLVEGLRHSKPPLTRASLVQGLEALGQLDLGGFAVRYGRGAHAGSAYVGLKGGGTP